MGHSESTNAAENRAAMLGKPPLVLAEAERIGENLYRTSAGLFLVMSPARKLRAYQREYHARQYLKYLARHNGPPATEKPVMRILSSNAIRNSKKQVGASSAARATLAFALFVFVLSALGTMIWWEFDLPSQQSDRTVAAQSSSTVVPPAGIPSPEVAQPDKPTATPHYQSSYEAHPDQWDNPHYQPTQSDYDLIAKQYERAHPGMGQDMKDGLCAVYGNCR